MAKTGNTSPAKNNPKQVRNNVFMLLDILSGNKFKAILPLPGEKISST
jgi:hypothetical protein